MSDLEYLFLGDSITDAGHLWEEDPRSLGSGYVRKISEHPAFHHARLVNRGQDGFTSVNLLRLVKTMDDLADFDCISILIGANDLSVVLHADPDFIKDSFKSSMTKLLSLIRSRFAGKLYIMEPFIFTVVAEHIHQLPYLAEETSILKDLAECFDACYIETNAAFTQALKECSSPWEITVDGVHLTPRGNQLLADLWISRVLSQK